MIDLHMHTIYSDGDKTPVELLKMCEDKKIKCISITDHDTCLAYKDMEDMRKVYSGKIIVGCELSTYVCGTHIELLGYNVNPDVINSTDIFTKVSGADINRYEVNTLIDICKGLGMKIVKNNIKYDVDNDYGNIFVHSEITKYQENKKYFESERSWNDNYVFYRECICNPNSKFFVNEEELFVNVKTAIDLIKEANGLVFVPHIFVYGENSERILDTLINKYHIDGIECYYPLFTKEQTEKLLNIARKHRLYISGGSDYHGEHKPNVELGTGIANNLYVPDEIIKEWARC